MRNGKDREKKADEDADRRNDLKNTWSQASYLEADSPHWLKDRMANKRGCKDEV